LKPLRDILARCNGATGDNASQRLLADMVESSFDAIFSRSLDGTITSWNSAAHCIFGYSSKEIVGRNGSRLLPPDRPDEQAQLIERIRKGERIDHFETVRLQKGGRRLAVSLTVSPIHDGRKRIIGKR
jgi:PAS domain S-box-containing protein